MIVVLVDGDGEDQADVGVERGRMFAGVLQVAGKLALVAAAFWLSGKV